MTPVRRRGRDVLLPGAEVDGGGVALGGANACTACHNASGGRTMTLVPAMHWRDLLNGRRGFGLQQTAMRPYSDSRAR